MMDLDGRTPAAIPRFREDVPSFEKLLKKTSFVSMKHGHRFGVEVLFRYGGETTEWKVKVNVYRMTKYGHVSFACGFREFYSMYHLEVGERLQFELVGKNRFTVKRANDSSSAVGELKEVANNSI